MAKRQKKSRSRRSGKTVASTTSTPPSPTSASTAPGPPRRAAIGWGAIVGGLVLVSAAVGWWLLAAITSGGPARSDASTSPGAPVDIPTLSDRSGLDPRMLEAVDAALERLRRSPTSGQAQGDLGRIYHAHKYFELARRCYLNAHRLDPATAAWPYYLGLFAAERGDLDQAIGYLETAEKLDRGYETVHYRLGDVLLRAGRYEKAERHFAALAELAPDSPWGHLGRGRVARRRGDLVAAVEHLERARDLDPENREVRYLLARSYRSVGREKEAADLIAEIEQRPIAHPHDPLLLRVYRLRSDLQRLITRGNRLLDEGQRAAAEEEYRAVLEFDPEHFDALFNLGVLTGRAGRYAEAAGFLERATKIRPEHSDAHFLLAMSYASSGRIDDAEREVNEVLRLEPKDQRALELLKQIEEGRARTRR